MKQNNKFKEFDQLASEGDLNLSSERVKWRDEFLVDETLHWLERDEAAYLHQSMSTPCLDVIEQASDSFIQNLQGHKYLDFHGNSVHQVGFGHPNVIQAIKEQLDQLPFCPRRFTNLPAIHFAERLAELAPGDLNRVLFAPGGTSAVGMALKLARYTTGKFKTISMWDSFHGASLDAISLGGEAIFRQGIGPLLPGTEHVPPPNPSLCPFKCGSKCSLHCADYVDYVLEKEGDVAAVISETVSSIPCFPPPEYWKRVREACDRHNALLILDEVPHSLGRIGTLFSFENYGIVPDMVVLGKGLGGGVFPIAAVIVKEDFNVAQQFSVGHYTHEKNPVACAAGLATINTIVDENLPNRARELGAYALQVLNDAFSDNPYIREIRGMGLLLGVELDHQNCDATVVAERIMYECLRNGLSFKISMGNVLTLAPPLNVSKEDLNFALTVLVEAVKTESQ